MDGQKLKLTDELPISYDVDITVVGGGPAGVAAAFQAARSGKSVLVIEQMNCLGGIATAGLHGHICCYDAWHTNHIRVVGGTCYDVAMEAVRNGHGTFNGYGADFEVEWFKLLLERELEKYPGLQVLYYTQFSDVVVEGDRIQYVIIQNKSGRQAVKTKIVIDASGDADVAACAGVPYEKGRDEDGKMQPMTLMYQIGDVNYERFQEYLKKGYYEQFPDDPDYYGMRRLWRLAQENGDMEPFQTKCMGWWWCATRPDQMGINFTHITGKDPTNTEDLTFATIEGRRQAFAATKVFNKYVPGLENAYVIYSAALIGTRESRRILGEYRITAQDLIEERKFEDSIGYGSFFIDIHNCSGPGMDADEWHPEIGFKYQIPYGALVPQKIQNLLVAGRCISCDHIALGSLRVMPQCFIEGDAAGVAAALAVDEKSSVGAIDRKRLQQILRSRGAIVTEEDIIREEE